MKMRRRILGFTTILLIACGALGGLAAPAVAKTIMVTTLIDTAHPPFDTDGACGTGTVSDLPAHGLVSLREAIIAANNTLGADTITFDPNLSGGTIVVGFNGLPLPALCGGQTSINGDLNGDGVPDITLEGGGLPVFAPAVAAAGILVLSSHNTINGLHVQHFPIGIQVRAGGFTTPGTVTHTTVTNNLVTGSKIDGINVRTGNVPDSRVAHTTLTQNKVINNTRFGIIVVANLSGVGSYTQIAHTTITDNEVKENGVHGIFMFSLGAHNDLSDATIAYNTVADNTAFGIYAIGGYAGAEDNTLDVCIRGNTVTANGRGIIVLAGQDNSSHNHVVARIAENSLEQNQVFGIEAVAANGAADFTTGISEHNVLDVRIERNMVESQTGVGILVAGGIGSPNGREDAVANNNQNNAIVTHNVVEGSTEPGLGMSLVAGAAGLSSSNILNVQAAHNTICGNGIDLIFGRGGFSPGNVFFEGTGNVLEGRIFQNTVGVVDIADGAQGNTAMVTEFNNDPCP